MKQLRVPLRVQFIGGPLEKSTVLMWYDPMPPRLYLRAPVNYANLTFSYIVEIVNDSGARWSRFISDVDLTEERTYVYELNGLVYRLVKDVA